MTSQPPALVDDSRAVLTRHARSFRWAGALLPAAQLDDAAVLYAFCRLVDDLADEAPEPARARSDLAAVRAELLDQAPARPLVAATRALLDRGPTGIAPALHLLDGVVSDLDPVALESDADLLRYGYRVAGTVGLMMCGVLGVRARQALPFAVDLGVAMQVTNICRDVREDAARGRVYLPAARLVVAGVAPERLVQAATAGPDLDAVERDAVASVVTDLLRLADRYYDSANLGMRWIPLRARLAIHVASRVYRAIGHRLRRRRGDAWAGRAWVGPLGKVGWSLVGLVDLARNAVRPARPHLPDLHLALRDLPGCGA
jgi:phytoene synthase